MIAQKEIAHYADRTELRGTIETLMGRLAERNTLIAALEARNAELEAFVASMAVPAPRSDGDVLFAAMRSNRPLDAYGRP